MWRPPVDLRESQDAIEIVVELPGIAAEAVKVALTNTELRIGGEKRQRVPRRRARAHLCSERTYGRFERTVPLRWTISVREATARLQDGVLTIRLPKATVILCFGLPPGGAAPRWIYANRGRRLESLSGARARGGER